MGRYFSHETAIIDKGAQIGSGTRIWHFSHVMGNTIIGENCNIGQNVFIASEVMLGNNVKVQNNVSLYTGLACEDDVFLGPSVVFTNVRNPRSHVIRKGKYEKTTIRRGATLGANATVMCGIEIGKFAFIGAGTVVLENVKPYALIVGNPGIQIGWMSESGHRLEFNDNDRAICPETNQIYVLDDGNLIKQNAL